MKGQYRLTTQAAIRREFWETFPGFADQARAAGKISKGQNAQCATVRCTFCDWLDGLARDGAVSTKLAQRATL
jgi:hypothetical protein